MMPEDIRPKIIVLNGVGSVGKSSTAKALQALTLHPFLHVSMDDFIAMLPDRLFNHPEGMIFETITEDDHPSVIIHSGVAMNRLMAGMRGSIAALARAKNNLIVDDVMLHPDEAENYRLLVDHADVHIVGLFAPLFVLEEREKRREDRTIGLARWQYPRVHQGQNYDLRIDTEALGPEDNAIRICKAFNL